MIATIDRTKSGEVVFTKSKSILLKTMKIRRIYDARDADAPLHLLLHQGDDGQLQAQPLRRSRSGAPPPGKTARRSREDDLTFLKCDALPDTKSCRRFRI